MYSGNGNGLGTNLEASDCTATNGCGAHIHSGTSCENTALQGGHYFENQDVDPWTDERYTSDASGVGTFSGMVDIGATNSLNSRAFLLHASDGSRVACGLLGPLSEYASARQTYSTQTEGISSSGVKGEVMLVTDDSANGEICIFGNAVGLEAGILSGTHGGADCSAKNGCGTHVHSGNGCSSATEQGGHYWNDTHTTTDPWIPIGYPQTGANGDALFAACVQTGIMNHRDYDNTAFVIHANDGSRVSCGTFETAASSSAAFHGSIAAIAVLAISTIASFLF